MLHHSQLEPGSGVYVEQFSCVLKGPLDRDRFEQAWRAVVQRHDVLRTLFIRLGEERPMQVVRKRVELPFTYEDWSAADEPAQRRAFESLLAEDRGRGFDPSVAPLMRLKLLRLDADRHRFLWTYHHAILDGWSMPILLQEVFQFYAAPHAPLPVARADYRHYIGWLRKQDAAPAEAFWKQQLAGYRQPLAFSPAVAPRPSTVGGTRRLSTQCMAMSARWLEAASRLCRSQKITLNTLCQGAWSLLLARYADVDDVVHGLVMSGRAVEIPGIDRMVGLFINTLPMRTRLPDAMAVGEWLRQLQSTSLEMERYAQSALSHVLQCAEVPRGQPLFDTIYVFENYPGRAAFGDMVGAQGLQVEDVRAVEETNYGLALIVVPGNELDCRLTYDCGRFDAAAVGRMLAQYRGLLERLLQAEHLPLGEVGLEAFVSAQERAGSAESDATLITDLLAAHARQTPGRPAWVDGDLRLDYGTLQAQVDRGIDYWACHGHRPGDRVLLHGDKPGPALVMLLSGLAYGLDCVIADPQLPLDEVLAAGPRAWGAAGLHRCVVTAPVDGVASQGLRIDTFATEGPWAAALSPKPEPRRGACSLLGLTVDGQCVLTRWDHAQLGQTVEETARAHPAREGRDVPLTGPDFDATVLW
ncbi:MAG: condensation domain-containing protein, partial [Rhizobacter sp.]